MNEFEKQVQTIESLTILWFLNTDKLVKKKTIVPYIFKLPFCI